jgi:hypothetical protein
MPAHVTKAVLRDVLAGLVALSASAAPSHAYTAAGDRIFAATLLLPQRAPSDDLYFTTGTLPSKSTPSASDQATGFSLTYDKTLTERLGLGATLGYNRTDLAQGGTLSGWQNISTFMQYLLVLDQPGELEMTVGLEHEWGGTGARMAGANNNGATIVTLYTAKGFGSAPWQWLRPLAVTAGIGYQASDGGTRPSLFTTGGALEYSLPYLESKVANVDLPDWVRRLTPMVEWQVATPTGNNVGGKTSVLIAPGVTYAGQGWEFGIEAQLPATRAAGSGVGVIAQLHLALDFLFPDTLGRPLLKD